MRQRATSAAVLGPGGEELLFVDRLGQLRAHEFADGATRTIASDILGQLGLSSAGDRVLARATDETLGVWKVADGSRVLVLDLDDEGRSRLHEASTTHIGRRLAVVVDGRIVAAPTILNPLTEGEAYVTVAEPELERAFDALSARD